MSLRDLAKKFVEAEGRRKGLKAKLLSHETALSRVACDSDLAVSRNNIEINDLSCVNTCDSSLAVATVAWPCREGARQVSQMRHERHERHAATVETDETCETCETRATDETGSLSKPAATATPAPCLKPRIRCEPPFGCGHVPARYRPAWEALLSQCPPALTPIVWQAAIFDAATLFGEFGKLVDEYRWTPGDLFDVPHDDTHGGLVWFIKGSPVVAIGRAMAQTQDGRIWRRQK
jgi:hypothetical protein